MIIIGVALPNKYPLTHSALLCHEGIMTQSIGLSVCFGLKENDTILINLPPSHVGCITEQVAATIFGGAVSVLLHIFYPQKSLEAIQEHRVTLIGQMQALFNMEWRLPDYDKYDLSEAERRAGIHVFPGNGFPLSRE